MTRTMKDSGVEWIGQIPKHWKIEKGKYCLSLLNRPIKIDDEIITCFRDGEVTLRAKRREDGFTVSLQETGYQGINPGDLVVHGMDGFAGAIGISDSRGKATPVLNVLDTTENKKFFMYYLRTAAFAEVFIALSTGIRVRSCDTNWNKLKKLEYLLPPLPEQQAIADYLDDKCAQIDNITATINEQIEVLKQYKKSVITEAVTKGLDPNAPMKDSGFEWIGQIPEKWEVIRLKYVMDNFDSQRKPIEAQKRSQEGEFLYDYYGASGVIDKINNYIFDKPALLIGEDGANLLLRNLPLIYIATGKYWVNNHAHILRPKNNLNFYYAAYLLEALDYTVYITGSAQPKLSQEKLNSVKILVPALSEQQAIADYLDDKCAQIDAVIADKQTQLETLAAYKKSLIYEYVTGKKSVPGFEEA